MDFDDHPSEEVKYLEKLRKTNAVGGYSPMDKTLLNYLSTQKYDEDYVESLKTIINYKNTNSDK